MAVSQEVVLKVLAQVASAVKDLNKVLELVRSLGSETKANSPLKLDLQIGEGLARLKELRASLEATIKAANGDGGKIQLKLDVGAIDKELRDLASRIKSGVSEIKGSFDGLSKVKVDLGLARKGSQEFREFQAELRKLEAQFRGAVDRLNTASRGVTFDPISRSATLARDRVRIAAENMVSFLEKIPPAVQRDEAAFARLQSKVEALRTEAAKLAQIQVLPPGGLPAANALTGALGSLEKAFNLAKVAGQLFFASIIVQKLTDLGASAVKAASDLQILKGQLEIFVGGPEQAADAIDHLRSVADDVGVSFTTLTDNFQRFLVPAQAAGLSLKETQQVFDAIAIAVAGAGKSTEEVNGIFKTFTDVLQKGVIQAEELVKQFANNGIPATALLARAYNKTTAEVREMTKEHQILARDGVPALAAEMLKVYGPAALKNVESFRSENERFQNAVLDLKRAFGDELLPVLSETLRLLQGLGGEGSVAGLGGDVAFLVAQFNGLLTVINGIREADFTAYFTGLTSILGEFLAQLIRAQKTTTIIAAEIAESLRLVPDGFADGIRDQLDQAIDKLRGVSKEARKVGEESRKGSEEAGKGVEDLAGNWESLYKDLKRQQRDHQKNTDASEKEITKKQLAEIKKREDAYKSFFQKLADLSKEPTDVPGLPEVPGAPASVSGPDVKAGDTSALDKLRADLAAALAAKRELELQPSVSTEDLAQIDAYRRQIQDLETSIRSYGSSANDAAASASAGLEQSGQAAAEAAAKVQAELGEKALEALRQLITGADEFAAAFAELGPKAQQQITAIVQAFEQAAASGNLSRSQIEQFGLSLVQAFQQGGLVGQQFAAQLAAAFGTAGTAAGSLAQTLRGLAEGSVAASSSLNAAGATATTAAGQIDQLLEKTDAAASGFIEVKGKSDQLKEGLHQVGLAAKGAEGNFIGVRDAAGNLGPNLLAAGEDAKTAKNEIDGVAVAAAKAEGNFIGVRDAAGGVGPNLLEVTKTAKDAKEGVDDLSRAEAPTKLAEGLESTAASAEKVVDPIKSISESATKLGEATQVEGATKLGEALTALTAPAAGLAPPLDLVATAASRLSQAVNKLLEEPGLGTIESQLTPLSEPLQKLTEPAAQLAAAIEKLGQATQTVKSDGLNALAEAGAKLSSIAEPAGAAATSLAPLTEASNALGASLATTNAGASALTANLQAIGTASAELLASLSDPALTSGLDSLGESLATAAPNLGTVATEFDRFAQSLEASKVALPEVQTGIEAIAESVGKPEVKDGLGELADSIDKIAQSASGAGDGLVVVGESLAAIAGSTESASKGLAEIAKSLDAKKIEEGAAAIEKLGSSSATAATGTKNFGDALKDSKVEADGLTGTLDKATKATVALREEALRAAPVLRDQFLRAFKDLQNGVEDTQESIQAIADTIKEIGLVGIPILEETTKKANELALAFRNVASAAASAKQGISGIRLPPIVASGS